MKNYEITTSITKDKTLFIEMQLYIKSLEINSSKCTNFTLQSPKHKIEERFKYPYKTRCGYEMKSLDFVPRDNTKWVLRTDVDIVALDEIGNHLGELGNADIGMVPENRRFLGNNDFRIMKNLSKKLGCKPFDFTIKSLEDGEEMYPIFQCGVQYINAKLFDEINLFEEWNRINHEVEKAYGTFHSLELAWSLLIQLHNLDVKVIDDRFNYNPISNWRNGGFPEQKLRSDAHIPFDIFLLHYHKMSWLKPFIDDVRIKKVLKKVKIPKKFWKTKPY